MSVQWGLKPHHKIMPVLHVVLGSVLLSCTLGCATRAHVGDEYRQVTEKTAHLNSKRTVVFFLVDGLSVPLLSKELRAGRLPQIARYFRVQKGPLPLARTTFPSLTYPAIGSLISEKPVDQNGIYGNSILRGSEALNFESPRNLDDLNESLQGRTVFSRLKAKGWRTVSLDYGFYEGSDTHLPTGDFKAGLAILEKNYSYVDKKIVDSLNLLLEETPTDQWPDFIFVHLLGVDFNAHDHGPHSYQARDYLQRLDSMLGSALTLLAQAERDRSRQIVAFMSADHGFDIPVAKFVDIEKTLDHLDEDITVLNEGRFAALKFPDAWSEARRSAILKSFAGDPSIDLTAHRSGGQILIQSKASSVLLTYGAATCGKSSYAISVSPLTQGVARAGGTWSCPEALDPYSNRHFYPYFISNISHYFMSPEAPDAVVIPKPGVSFKPNYRGQHGGPTPQEVFVPLLMRNSALANPTNIPAIWDLLGFL